MNRIFQTLKKYKFSLATMSCLLGIVVISSCNHYDELKKSGNKSSPNEDSHNAGEDCMSCHHDPKNEASGRWWYVAGTIYNANGTITKSGGKVELWTGPNKTGTLLYTLDIDKSGNFYTQEIIDFQGGYFPVVISGLDTAMNRKVIATELNLSCNGCHGHNANGLNTPKITLK